MKLTCARADLVRALGNLSRIVDRRSTIPILSNVLLKGSVAGLHMTATDLDIEASASIPAEIAAPGAITVPVAILESYCKRLPDGAEISLSIEPDGGRVVVRSGRGRATIAALDAGDFPSLGEQDWPAEAAIAGRDLARLLGAVDFAMSSEETRYYLCGIYLRVIELDGAPVLRTVATDGHRLGRADMPCPAGLAGLAGGAGVIVPRKAVAEITRMADAAGADEVALSISSQKLKVRGRGLALTTKLIDGTFPDYARVIPAGNDKVVTVAAKDLTRAVDRVAAIATERGRAVKLDIAPGTLKLAVVSPDHGHAEDELDCRYDSAPLTIGMNGRYAGDILNALGADEVEIALLDPGSPMLWRAPGDPSRIYVLMPMRV